MQLPGQRVGRVQQCGSLTQTTDLLGQGLVREQLGGGCRRACLRGKAGACCAAAC